MKDKIIFEGKTEDGLEVSIRYVKSGDEKIMNEYINILSEEQTFISYQNVEVPADYEKEYVKKLVEKLKNNLAVHLLAFNSGKLIGSSDLNLNDPLRGAIKHVGTFGISILKEYRGKGLGKLLMKLVLDEAISTLSNLRIITLTAFATNDLALNMYKNFGFTQFGKLPKGLFRKGEYADEVFMYKVVKR